MAWIISCFSLTREAEEAWKNDPYPYRVVKQPWGYSYVTPEGELAKIDDATDITIPLFGFKDKVVADKEWVVNLSQPTETCIGNVIYNALVLADAFGDKVPFVTGRVNDAKVEAQIAQRLQSTPGEGEARLPNVLYVDELLVSNDNLQLLTEITQLCTVAATKKNITPPPGIKEFKAKLNEEYKGRLNNPIFMAEYESKLRAYAKDYMKDDPSDGIFFAGKVADTAYKKMYLTVGGIAGFGDGLEVTPVTSSLDEGWPTDPEQYAAMMNDLRIGSYARGAETVNGGVAAKVLLRAANNFSIKDTDCGAKLGRRLKVNAANLSGLVMRNIIVGGKLIFIKDVAEAEQYKGKVVQVRSPMFCKSPGDSLCRVCAGEKLNTNPNGLGIPLTEESGLILTASLKMMHGSVLSTVALDLDEVFT